MGDPVGKIQLLTISEPALELFRRLEPPLDVTMIRGGSTTAEVRPALEISVLHREIKPQFYELEYARFLGDAQ